MTPLLSTLVFLLIVVALVWAALWMIAQLGAPYPLGFILRLIIVVIGLIAILYKLLPMAGIAFPLHF